MSRQDEEATRITREIAARAIRRLDILEYVIFALAAGLALAGGALVAWVLSPALGFSFRSVWMATSLSLFALAGTIAIRSMREEERDSSPSTRPQHDERDV